MVRPRPRCLRRRRPASQARQLHSMDFIWSPWRYDYLASTDKKPPSCVFCIGDVRSRYADKLIVLRGIQNFIIQIMFAYTSGHTMVDPSHYFEYIVVTVWESLLDV